MLRKWTYVNLYFFFLISFDIKIKSRTSKNEIFRFLHNHEIKITGLIEKLNWFYFLNYMGNQSQNLTILGQNVSILKEIHV